MDLSIWIWVAIAAVVLVIIIIVMVIMTRGKGEERNRERATELRSRAAADDQLISTRHDRADQLVAEAEAARQGAMAEYERADSLRKQAGESDELAAHATDEAKILDDEATHSREAFETAVEEHEETLREADRRDPDVDTDRHGNRIEDADETAEEDAVVIPEEERLDIGDDYTGDEFAEPEAEYIDPVEHDRLAHLDEAALTEYEERGADDTIIPAEPETAEADPTEANTTDPVNVEPIIIKDDFSLQTDKDEPAREEEAPALDPYGNPVTMENDDVLGGAYAVQSDDLPRDEKGRLPDSYGNPIEEVREYQAPADDPVVFDDADDDVPRDEQGRRLDPYGNPVPENLQ